MKFTKSVLAAMVLLAAVVNAADDSATSGLQAIRGERIRAAMKFLADDALEGRGTATRGHELAAKYVASEFEAAGLEPAGDDGSYFQRVPLRAGLADPARSQMVLVRGGHEETFAAREDFITQADAARLDTMVEAPVVYVGKGVSAPELNYDDYRDIDVRGKIIALMSGAPPSFPSSLRAYYSSGIVKSRSATEHGAVGVIVIDDPVAERLYGFDKSVRDLVFPAMRWIDHSGKPNDYFPQLAPRVELSMEGTRRLFAGSGHSVEEVYAAARESKPLSFALPVTAKLRSGTTFTEKTSQNIAALLPGSDPVLKNEFVVYTAHIDHLGIGEPVKGDAIYNGALDNASGTAILMELARTFAGLKVHPKRSIGFVAVTGEEEGLRGSDYFAHYPTVPKAQIVANVNMDEDLMLWPLRDVIAFGAEHSSLEKIAEQAAARLHLSLSPDPQPEEMIFIRSDQYSFVKQGVPAIFPVPGFKSDDPAVRPQEIYEQWEAEKYHQPQDDMNQPLNWPAAVKFAQFNFLCGYLIAQAPTRPTWNAGDFFGRAH